MISTIFTTVSGGHVGDPHGPNRTKRVGPRRPWPRGILRAHDRRLRRLRGRPAPGRARSRSPRPRSACRQDGSFAWLGLFEPSEEEFERGQARVRPAPARGRGRGQRTPAPEARGLRRDAARRAEAGALHRPRRGRGDRGDRAVREPGVPDLGAPRQSEPAEGGAGAPGARAGAGRTGPAAVLYAILDRIVDDYEPVVEGVTVDIQEVEAQVFAQDRHNPAERIYYLEREVLDFNRAVAPAGTRGRAPRDAHLRRGRPRAAALLPRRARPHAARDTQVEQFRTCSPPRWART